MSVVINTNSAATMAAGNLAASSVALQRSLNRLSSGSRIVNPDDDAGGLAVSTKLSATAHRQAAVANNIADSNSFLQTQDGVLNVVGKVLSRVGELNTLYIDPTKNASDRADYDAEFTQLQKQLTSLAKETFNGVALFGTTGLNVGVTSDSNAGTIVNVGAAALMGNGMSIDMNTSGWTASSNEIDGNYALGTGGAYFNAGEQTIAFHNYSGPASYSSNQGVGTTGFTLSFDTSTNGSTSYSPMQITAGANSVNLTALLSGSADHHVAISDDGTNATISIDGGSGTTVASLGTGAFVFNDSGRGANDFHIGHISLAGSVPTNVSKVSTATSLANLSLSTVTSAVQDVATLRANNGASQSRLGFAAEVLTANKANIEAANSRIVDVDVADESTKLARSNVLTQAGTAMLAQANQSTQVALKLIG